MNKLVRENDKVRDKTISVYQSMPNSHKPQNNSDKSELFHVEVGTTFNITVADSSRHHK